MGNREAMQKELEDKKLKVRNAREAAQAPEASERDKADLKLREQELLAEQQKARREARQGDQPKKPEPDKPSKLEDRLEKKLDAALKDSFPGSDPVSFVEAAPLKKGDRDLTSVKVNDRKGSK
jgi:hypothetical protein